jgi:hypothetical protein
MVPPGGESIAPVSEPRRRPDAAGHATRTTTAPNAVRRWREAWQVDVVDADPEAPEPCAGPGAVNGQEITKTSASGLGCGSA